MKTKFILAVIVATAVILGGVWLIAAPRAPQRPQVAAQAPQEVPAAISSDHRGDNTPSVGTPTATPATILVSTSTTVTVKVAITPDPIPNGVKLLRIGPAGTQPTILGIMHEDGAERPRGGRDHIFKLRYTFDESAVGYIQLQVSAAFRTDVQPVASPVLQVPVWGVFTSNNGAFMVTYPPGLYPSPNVGPQAGFYRLVSSPQDVDIGGGKPEDGSTPSTSGFSISIEADPFTGSPFDINQWLVSTYPASEVESISNKTVDSQGAFEVIFQNQVGAGEPLVVIYHNGYVYQLSYASTYPLNSPADAAGLQLFNDVLGSFTFTH